MGRTAFLGRGFRPFFGLAGAAAVALVVLWLGVLRGFGPVPDWYTPVQWHAHEMLFGFAGAAISGFLLTSVPVWTGRVPLVGPALGGMALLWGLARVAIFCTASLPSPWIAFGLDVGFYGLLALWVGIAIYGSGSRRNYAFPLLLLGLAAATGSAHLGAMGLAPRLGAAGSRLGVGIVVLLVSIVGGRLVPLFTRAALKRQGHPVEIERVDWADKLSGPVIAVFFVSYAIWPAAISTAALAALGAFTTAVRARGWQLRASFRDPLLWSMHVAYLWIPIGLATFAVAPFVGAITPTIATHALTTGAIGGMILSIMSRVALGHTGRNLEAPRVVVLAYACVASAALLRTFGLVLLPDYSAALLMATGALWILAFGSFLVVYAPILVRPRVDGKPG
jgi:uncharacterized protein involved in response to NO